MSSTTKISQGFLTDMKDAYLKSVEKNIFSHKRNPRHTLINPKNIPLDESASVNASDSFNKMLLGLFRASSEISWLPVCLTTLPNTPTHGKLSASKLQYGEKDKDIVTILIDDTTAFNVDANITSDGGATGVVLFKSEKSVVIDATGTPQPWLPTDTVGGVEIRQLSNGVTNSLFVTGYTQYKEKADGDKDRGKNRYSIKIQDTPVQAESIMVPVDVTLEVFHDFQGDEMMRMNLEYHLGRLHAQITENRAIEKMKEIAERHSTLDLDGATPTIADTMSFVTNRILTDMASIRATGDVNSKFFTVVSAGVLAGLMTVGGIETTDEFEDNPSIIGYLSESDGQCLVILDQWATEEYILTGSRGTITRPNSGIVYLPVDTDIRYTTNHETLEPIIALFSTVAFPRNAGDSFIEGANSNYLRYSQVTGIEKIVYGASAPDAGGGATPPNPTQIMIGEY